MLLRKLVLAVMLLIMLGKISTSFNRADAQPASPTPTAGAATLVTLPVTAVATAAPVLLPTATPVIPVASSSETLEWAKVIGPIVWSWPTMALLAFLVFRKPLRDLIKQMVRADVRKAKIGPVEIERELGELAEKGKLAVNNINRLNELMAESRLLELEITEGMFGTIFTADQHQRMRQQIEELRKLTQSGKEQ